MLNKTLLEAKLISKFGNLALNAITTEAFVNGLPFDKNDLTSEDTKYLGAYTANVLESLGGFDAFVKSSKFAPIGEDILAICKESATEAACRVCKEEITGPNANKTLPEAVDGAEFTPDEYNKLLKSADSIDIDKVSEIIKDKVIKTIRDEKDAYEKQDELETELKEAINGDDPNGEKTVEGYMDIVLDKGDTRKHITLFSKLQDVSADVLSHTTESFTNIPYNTLNLITFENTLSVFNRDSDIDNCIEEIKLYTPATECDTSDVGSTSLICSVVIYTVLQTLKTLGLYSPPAASVAKFVETGCDKGMAERASHLQHKMTHMIHEINRGSMNTKNPYEITKYYDSLTRAKEALTEITNPDFEGVKEGFIAEINPILNRVKDTLNKAVESANFSPIPSQMDLRDKERTVSQFNKLNTLYAKNPNINKITLQVNPVLESNTIDVICKDIKGNSIDNTFIDVNHRPVFGTYMDFVKEAYNESKLSKCSKTVEVYLTDGSNKTVSL